MGASNKAIATVKRCVAHSLLIVPADFDAAPIKQLAPAKATDEQPGDFTGPRDGMVITSPWRGSLVKLRLWRPPTRSFGTLGAGRVLDALFGETIFGGTGELFKGSLRVARRLRV